MASEHYVSQVTPEGYILRDGTELETVWHGASRTYGEKGQLMPDYNSRSQMEMIRDHAKFYEPDEPFLDLSDDAMNQLNDEVAEAKGWVVDAA